MSSDGHDGGEKPTDRLFEDISQLAEALVQVRVQAEAVGVFTGERGLLECKRCGLREDVLAGGILIVVTAERPRRDTRLRFTAASSEPAQFACPRCGAPVQPEP